MKNSIPYTSFSGNAEQLCKPGNAVEFIQPWYTPISTTPENTGIAVGGIGNTFTLTPLGDTPSFAFIPGIFIDNSEEGVNFNDFYASVSDELSTDVLGIPDFEELTQFLRFYPATFLGQELSADSTEEALTKIRDALKSGLFYTENAERFERWNIEFTAKTLAEIKDNPASSSTQLLVAIDFFDGLLTNESAKRYALTASYQADDIQAVSADCIEFKALYPFAEFTYRAFEEVTIIRKVVSPVLRGNKKLCSLPMHWNEFELTNNTNQKKVVTLVQSLRNLIGSTYKKQRPGVQDSACTLTQNPVKQLHGLHEYSMDDRLFRGVLQTTDSNYASDIEGEVLFGVDVSLDLLNQHKAVSSAKPSVYCVDEQKSILKALNTGRVSHRFDKGIYSGREALASLVTVCVELEPNEAVSVRFAQVMDHSKIELEDWTSQKAYTQFYPAVERACTILEDVLPQVEDIETGIVAEQQSYLSKSVEAIGDESSSSRFATMAMNSLSFMAESSVWDINDKFLVKECVDYPFFNSLDVYFYGSFSLLYLLPELDGCVMRDFSQAILARRLNKASLLGV
ncbi:GH116 family glycosyl-hydrolase [Vibrio hannami]|uniref:GH116 family glycosyl-hydrolase n=1 Tax=Vibrio hannami TaxID=2717094 RepID=UPI00240EECBA|nr:GH116 family glycosyl-hydrolase [Vibrio hannami]MDG3085684.1 GH116 family glycosyl-hydrolase [Vibrio hannami]